MMTRTHVLAEYSFHDHLLVLNGLFYLLWTVGSAASNSVWIWRENATLWYWRHLLSCLGLFSHMSWSTIWYVTYVSKINSFYLPMLSVVVPWMTNSSQSASGTDCIWPYRLYIITAAAWLHAGMARENLEKFRQVKKKKKQSIKRDLNPLHSVPHTRDPPLHHRCCHCCQSLFSPSPSHPTLLTIGNPPSPSHP